MAVNDISFEVNKGEVLGFLGPNGAGKSTTMRMITGFFEPSAGQIKVGGVDILKDPIKAKQKIGYLPENAPLYRDMTVVGFLKFIADLRGYKGAEKNKAVDEALETCFLEPVRHQSVDTLSKGYKHRTCLAQSILHKPEILILDEPTDGLDPNQKREVRNLIKRIGEEKTVIFSTHILEEVDATCNRAIVISQGKIVADETPSELKVRGAKTRSIRVKLETGSPEKCETDISNLPGVGKVTVLSRPDDQLELIISPKKDSSSDDVVTTIAKYSQESGHLIHHIGKEEGTLEDAFKELTH